VTDLSRHEEERLALGAEFRALRQQAGMTGAELAGAIGISQSKISKLENGKLLPTESDLDHLARALRLPKPRKAQLASRIAALSNELTSVRLLDRSGLRARQLDVQALERASTDIRVFQPGIVPGLLQTADYAFEVLSMANIHEQADVGAAVAARLQRQIALFDRQRKFTFIVTESALRWPVGGTSTRLAQLSDLRSLLTQPNVRTGVLELSQPNPVPPITAYAIYDCSLVVVETLTDDFTVRDPEDVKVYVNMFDLAAQYSVWGADADAVLSRVFRDLDGPEIGNA
jgi:transcriptional regulator with XRE-family HTH domain